MNSSLLVLADGLELVAVEAAAQRLAWVGTSGSGKTYGCGRYVEQAHACNIPVLILDTVSLWPPIRLAADGKRPGLPFVIVGGDHADVPLELGRGAELARFLITQNASAVVDLSDYAPDERAPFVADLCERLLIELKHQKKRRPRFVVYDEAQDLAPQIPAKGEARMLKAVSALIRKGRNHLCGTVLLTQRPADVSKTALNLCGNLFLGGMFAAHDRKAMRDWAGAKARSPLVEQQLKELPELQPGEFFFWSPSWMKRYQRVHVLPKWTFDGSSSTPLPSDAELGKVAPVDVQALRALLTPPPAAAPLEGVKARQGGQAKTPVEVSPEDASELAAVQRRNVELAGRVHELEKQAQVLQGQLWTHEAFAKTQREQGQRLEAAVQSYFEAVRRVDPPPELAFRAMDIPVTRAEAPLQVSVMRRSGFTTTRIAPSALSSSPTSSGATTGATTTMGATEAYCQDVLEAIVAYGPLDRERLSLLSGKSRSSSTFASALRKLLGDGWVLEVDRRFAATEKGRRQAQHAPLPLGRALYDHYRAKLSPYDAETLDAVVQVRGGLTRQELAERTGHSLTSSTFADSIRTLKNMGLCEEASRRVRLIDHVRVSMGLG